MPRLNHVREMHSYLAYYAPEHAVREAHKAVSIAPNDKAKAAEYIRLGKANFSLGRYEEALEAFKKSDELTSNPDSRQWILWCVERINKLKMSGLHMSDRPESDISGSEDPKPTNSEDQKLAVSQVPGNEVKLKHDFYQTESYVVVTLMVKDKLPDDVTANFSTDYVKTTIRKQDKELIEFSFIPCYPIVPEQCSYKVLKTKIEVKLKKSEGIRWSALERQPDVTPSAVKVIHVASTATSTPPSYPSSAKTKHDWSRLEAEISKEEEEGEGEEALNRLFKKIYSENSDDVKRAMMKSFSESGGTVLSTNWDEVAKEQVTVKPPDGMEFKKWEQ